MSREIIHRPGHMLAPQLDYIILDGSGSMMDKWFATIGALEGYVDVLRTQNIHSHGIVQVFEASNIASIQRDSTLADWPQNDPLTARWGDTPLYDAINYAGRQLRDLDPPKAHLVIVTDGHENASRHTTDAQARAILNWCRAKGWQVTFLGADFNNSRQAALLGANKANSIGVQKTRLLEAGKTLGEKRLRNIRTGDDITFSDEEKTEFGGYLTGPASRGD